MEAEDRGLETRCGGYIGSRPSRAREARSDLEWAACEEVSVRVRVRFMVGVIVSSKIGAGIGSLRKG